MIYSTIRGEKSGDLQNQRSPVAPKPASPAAAGRANSTCPRSSRDTSHYDRASSAHGERPLGREAATGHCGRQSSPRGAQHPLRDTAPEGPPTRLPIDAAYSRGLLGDVVPSVLRTNAGAARADPAVSRACRAFLCLQQVLRAPGRDGVLSGLPPQRLPACCCHALTLRLYPRAVLPADTEFGPKGSCR